MVLVIDLYAVVRVLHAHPLSFKATEQGFEMGLPEKAVEPIEAIKAWAWPPPPGRPIASVVHSTFLP